MFTVGPEVTALHTGAEQKVRLGITARLGCLVKGYPAADINWFKDGTGVNCLVENFSVNFLQTRAEI